MLDFGYVMAKPKMFRNAVEAIRHNQREKARDLLTRLLRADKNNPDYWLWLSSVVDTEKERIYCLNSVLRLEPENQAATRALRLLGEMPPDDEMAVLPPVKRSWEVELEKLEPKAPGGLKRIWANSKLRTLVLLVAGVILAGLIIGGIMGTPAALFGPQLTITPVPWTATNTLTPSATPLVRTATPTPEFVQPLWTLLDATYTPRPLYVNTPHPRSEAYDIGLRAYLNSDYERALDFMQQALQAEPDAPDIQFYVAETQRHLGQYDQAIENYDAVIATDEEFAPAYLGRALAELAQSPDARIEDDLEQVIETVPDYKPAYLELAALQVERGEPETALETLEQAQDLLADSPRYYAIRAEAYLALGEDALALENAEEANQRDITALPVYLLLAQAYLENDQPDEAMENISIYGAHMEGDLGAIYWAMLGWTRYENENYEDALEALEKALELDEEIAFAHQYHGMTVLAMGEPAEAINDLYRARQLDPDSFAIRLNFALALWADDRDSDAYQQINTAEEYAHSDEDFAKIYYYRAQIAHELSQFQREDLDWEALLALPPEAVTDEWLEQARLALTPTVTPTP